MALSRELRSVFHAARTYASYRYLTYRKFGRYAPLIPPIALMHDGPADYLEFKRNAEEFFRHYTNLCGLRPNEKMLDVGSGIGRKTFLLADYLAEDGSYDGLEIVKPGVDWCTARIARRNHRFKFHLIDVYNQHFNPSGHCKASEYRFPFDDESFDFVVLGSVFTHMLPEDMENYVSQIARVLKPGARCFISFFLLNEQSVGLLNAGNSSIDFRYRRGPFCTIDTNSPEAALAYDEEFITSLYYKYGLEIRPPIFNGSWSGREDSLSYQDLVLAYKPNDGGEKTADGMSDQLAAAPASGLNDNRQVEIAK